MSFDNAEFYRNPEPRCACMLLLDTSQSMRGEPLEELMKGVALFRDDLADDFLASKRVEVGIVTFGKGGANVVQDFVSADTFSPPVLEAGGKTPMGEAILLGLDKVQERKARYRSARVDYFRPWVFLITDGKPTDEWQEAARRIRQGEQERAFSFYAVGVGGADLDTLARISVTRPRMLKGLNFGPLFQWLSNSLQEISHSQVGDRVNLQPPDGWSVY